MKTDTLYFGKRGAHGIKSVAEDFSDSDRDLKNHEFPKVHVRKMKPGLRIGTHEDVKQAVEELGQGSTKHWSPGQAQAHLHPDIIPYQRGSQFKNDANLSMASKGKTHSLVRHLQSKGLDGIMHDDAWQPRTQSSWTKSDLTSPRAVTLFDPHKNTEKHHEFADHYNTADRSAVYALEDHINNYYNKRKR